MNFSDGDGYGRQLEEPTEPTEVQMKKENVDFVVPLKIKSRG